MNQVVVALAMLTMLAGCNQDHNGAQLGGIGEPGHALKAPEIDPAALPGAFTLLGCIVLCAKARK